MKLTAANVNRFLLLKLPSAWLCGVRLKSIDEKQAIVSVKYRWINQNPFGSMYFAVQMMAAELSTGALVMKAIRESGASISMLVASNKAEFSKKAIGRITFTCADGISVTDAVRKTIETGEPICITLLSEGKDELGQTVSQMAFEWTLKARNNR